MQLAFSWQLLRPSCSHSLTSACRDRKQKCNYTHWHPHRETEDKTAITSNNFQSVWKCQYFVKPFFLRYRCKQNNIMSKIIGINLFTIGVSATLIGVWKEGGFDMYLTALGLLILRLLCYSLLYDPQKCREKFQIVSIFFSLQGPYLCSWVHHQCTLECKCRWSFQECWHSLHSHCRGQRDTH